MPPGRLVHTQVEIPVDIRSVGAQIVVGKLVLWRRVASVVGNFGDVVVVKLGMLEAGRKHGLEISLFKSVWE